MTTAHTGGPLSGVRVVELAGLGPAPHASMMLADLGADVVRVDRPGERRQVVADEVLQRGRRVVRVDLRSPEGVAQVHALIARADVLIEGFRPGVTERLGVGPDEALATNPRLVYARMTGWGQEGPMSARAGHDINYLGLTGALAAIGRPGALPTIPLNLVADFGGGSMLLVVGVLAALMERGQSGRGQVIDAAMVDGVAVLCQLVWSMRGAGDWSDERGDNLLDGGAPFYDTYACADGRFVAVGALEPQFYEQLLNGLGLDGRDLPDRSARAAWPQLRAIFAERFSARSRDEWAGVFSGTDACVTPVVEWAEAVDQPHLAGRRTLTSVDGVVQASPAPRFSRTPGAAGMPPTSTSVDAVIESWPSPA